VLDAIEQTRAAPAAYLVAELLCHGPAEVRPQAGRCLLALACGLLPPPVEGAGSAVAQLRESIEDALKGYARHRQTSALLAAARLDAVGWAGLWTILDDRAQPASDAMAQLIVDGRDPAIRRNLLVWMSHRAFAAAALTALVRYSRTGRLAESLERWHLLLHGGARLALLRVTEPAKALPSPTDLAAMPPQSQGGLPALVSLLPMSPAQRLDALAPLATATDRHVRLAVLRQLVTPPLADAVDAQRLVLQFTRDADAALAVLALRHLIAVSFPNLRRLLAELADSPHEDVRRMVWQAYPKLDPQRRRAAASAIAKLDHHLPARLRDALASGDAARQVRALQVIGDLSDARPYEEELIRLARGSDPKLAATAVKALASLDSQRAIEALQASLAHGDPRVRSNAIEALCGRRRHHDLSRHIVQLNSMAAAEHHRPRGTAVRELLRLGVGGAREALVAMLADRDARHRVSALWAAEAACALPVSGQVAELSISDADPAVRQRAARAVRLMLEVMTRKLTKPADVAKATGKSPAPEKVLSPVS
jgi:hypothetical protein